MAEIHLPTKVTQDEIKQDTEFIKGQFPISGGGIKSVQRGVLSSPSFTDNVFDVVISEVDTSKAYINLPNILISVASGSSGSISDYGIFATLTGPTNLRFTISRWRYSGTIAWEVIEFE